MMKSKSFLLRLIGVLASVSFLFSGSAAASASFYESLSPQQIDFFVSIYTQNGVALPPGLSAVAGGSEDGEVDGQDNQQQEVVTLEAVNRGERSIDLAPVTFGQVFKKGDVSDGTGLTAEVDGQRVSVQVDKKATWQDGSLRHAVLSLRVPQLSAGGTKRISLLSGQSDSNQSAITLSDLLATDFESTAEFTLGGQTVRSSARALLAQAAATGGCSAWGLVCKRWLSGPLVSEWIVGGPVTGPQGDAQANLAVYFHVRAYSGASGRVARVRVDTVIENNWAYGAAAQNLAYDATLTTGSERYDISDLTHYDHARWHKVLWWRGAPDVYARVNTDYLQASRAVSAYADVTPGDAFLDAQASAFAPMDHGDQTRDMSGTGAQPAIGPLPRWTAAYVVSGDARAFDWMRANDDAAGSYSFHYRDPATGRPLDIVRHPYATVAAFSFANYAHNPGYKKDLFPRCAHRDQAVAEDCNSPLQFNIAHHPSIGYVAYLVTGDYYYLEEMQFTASYVELWMNPNYRDYAKGHISGSARFHAWSLRSLLDAAFITPDDDPLKSYYGAMVANNIAEYRRTLISDANPLHLMNYRGAVRYTSHGQSRTGVAPWQQDFFMWAVGHAAEQGVAGARELRDWLAAFAVGRMTNWQHDPDGACWLQAAVYTFQIRPAKGAPDYASLADAYQANFPDLQGLECNSQEMVNLWAGGRYQRGEMSGYANSPTGFPSNFQVALAMAADSDLPDAAHAWQIFENRSIQPDYSDYANFAVIPRGTE